MKMNATVMLALGLLALAPPGFYERPALAGTACELAAAEAEHAVEALPRRAFPDPASARARIEDGMKPTFTTHERDLRYAASHGTPQEISRMEDIDPFLERWLVIAYERDAK